MAALTFASSLVIGLVPAAVAAQLCVAAPSATLPNTIGPSGRGLIRTGDVN